MEKTENEPTVGAYRDDGMEGPMQVESGFGYSIPSHYASLWGILLVLTNRRLSRVLPTNETENLKLNCKHMPSLATGSQAANSRLPEPILRRR